VVLREGKVLAAEVPPFLNKQLANVPEDAYLITKDGYKKLTVDFGSGDIYVKA